MAQLRFNLLTATFKDVHRHLSVIAVFERDWRRVHARYFVGRKQPHPIYQNQISHAFYVTPPPRGLNPFAPGTIKLLCLILLNRT